MKTISFRKFRDSIPDLTEQVSVTRRSPDGEYVILGQWSPTIRHTAGECWCADCTHAALNPPHSGAVPYRGSGFGTSRPAPKHKR